MVTYVTQKYVLLFLVFMGWIYGDIYATI
jgi:hypothetical protein